MKSFTQKNKTRLLLIAGALFVFYAGQANAQSSNETTQLLNRINQLENQIQTMSRALYRGDRDAQAALSAAASAGDTNAAANFEVRMSQIEEQQRKLTGEIERIGYDVQQLKSRVTRFQTDTEQRFQQQTTPTPALTPDSPVPDQTQSTVGTLGTIPGGSAPVTAEDGGPAEALYEEAFTSVKDTHYDQAEVKFREFLTNYPRHSLAANAQYWLGETYYVRGDYKSAAKSFAQGYQDFPKSSKAADSLFKLGLSLAKLGKTDDACLSLRQMQKEFQNAAGPLQRKADQEIKQLSCP